MICKTDKMNGLFNQEINLVFSMTCLGLKPKLHGNEELSFSFERHLMNLMKF